MNPVDNIVDFTAASSTLSNVTTYATPIFASTIKPAAFMLGPEIGGIIVAALIGAVIAAVMWVFKGTSKDEKYDQDKVMAYWAMHGENRTSRWEKMRLL